MAHDLHAPNARRTDNVVVQPAELRLAVHRHGRGDQGELARQNQREGQRQTERLAQGEQVFVGQPLDAQQGQHEGDGQRPKAQALTCEEIPDVRPESAHDVVEGFQRVGVRAELNQTDVLVSRPERRKDGQREDERRGEGNQPRNGARSFVGPEGLDVLDGLKCGKGEPRFGRLAASLRALFGFAGALGFFASARRGVIFVVKEDVLRHVSRS